jgi:peptidoglycan-associated lipoprotein
MMFALRSTVGALAAAALMAGCSSTKLDTAAPVETRATTPSGSATDGAGSGASAQSQVTTVDLSKQNADANNAAARVIYFDFDSYVVKDAYRPVVEAQAKRLSANTKQKVSVEGHTDERGGREYNLALGQKRAEAVVKSLTLLGVSDGQLEAVSFGKERPAAQGSDEEAWAKNRRVELKDR